MLERVISFLSHNWLGNVIPYRYRGVLDSFNILAPLIVEAASDFQKGGNYLYESLQSKKIEIPGDVDLQVCEILVESMRWALKQMNGMLREVIDGLVYAYLARVAGPWLEKLAATQQQADLQHYNERFDSFKQLSGLLEHIDGRGSDPHAQHQVDGMITKMHEISNQLVDEEVRDSSGPSDYERQKAEEDPWESV